jgi:hypothetical protein
VIASRFATAAEVQMKACSLCAALYEESNRACPRCGIASQIDPRLRHPRGLVALAAVGVLFLGGAIAWAAVQGRSADRCEPSGWVEWHVAMKEACLTPAYVCEHLTSAKLLEDPEVADAFQGAMRGGAPGALAHLDALVGRMRSAYGCDGGAAQATPAPALPPGHPPIDGGGARLPPGHPPIDAQPRSPMFEPPSTLSI